MISYDKFPRPLHYLIYNFYRHLILPLLKQLSVLAFRLSNGANTNQEVLKSLRGVHNGKRAFIIGNGPSLTPIDLERINENEDISFASNHIWKIFAQTSWRPTYYAQVNDGIPIARHKVMMENAEAKYKFFRTTNYLQTKKISGQKLYLNVQGDGTLDNPHFTEDISKVVYAMGTTTFVLIELAIYMGCSELYIIGCDHSYSLIKTRDGRIIDTGHKSYFEEADKTARQVPVETWQMEFAYEFAKQYADAHGIKIYNAGRGGHLETFERIDFDSLFC